MMAAPEDVQQVLVGDDRRVKIDLDGLGVVAEVAVGGVGLRAARVPYPGADDAVDNPELGIRSPESAQAEGGGLGAGGNRGIQGRNLSLRGLPGSLHDRSPCLMAVIVPGLTLQGGGNVKAAGVLSRSAGRQAKTQGRRGYDYVQYSFCQFSHIDKIIVIDCSRGKVCREKFFLEW